MLKPASATETATGTPAARTSATEAATEAAAASTTTARTAEATTVTRTAGPAAKDVQTVDDVQHGILVNGVILRVVAHHFVDAAGNVRLLVQQVEELQADGEGPALQEAV